MPLVEVQSGVTAMEKVSFAILQKNRNSITILSTIPLLAKYTKKIESRDLSRYLYTHVHRNIIHISQGWKQPK